MNVSCEQLQVHTSENVQSLESIETEMESLHELFQLVNQHVQEQADQINHLEDQIVSASIQTAKATEQLVEARTIQSSTRKLALVGSGLLCIATVPPLGFLWGAKGMVVAILVSASPLFFSR